jgi:hypothetical protein
MPLDKETFLFSDPIQPVLREAELKIHYPVANVAGHVMVMLVGVENPSTAHSIEASPIRKVDTVQNSFVHELANGSENRRPSYGRARLEQSLL